LVVIQGLADFHPIEFFLPDSPWAAQDFANQDVAFDAAYMRDGRSLLSDTVLFAVSFLLT
jgi:hypothetical protein